MRSGARGGLLSGAEAMAQKLFVEDAPMDWHAFEPAYLLTWPSLQSMPIYADYIMRFHAAWLKA